METGLEMPEDYKVKIIGSITIIIRHGLALKQQKGKDELSFSSNSSKEIRAIIQKGLEEIYPIFNVTAATERAEAKFIADTQAGVTKKPECEEVIRLETHLEFRDIERIEMEFQKEKIIPLTIQTTDWRVQKVLRKAATIITGPGVDSRIHFILGPETTFLKGISLIPTKKELEENPELTFTEN